jgi:hypothetical protein
MLPCNLMLCSQSEVHCVGGRTGTLSMRFIPLGRKGRESEWRSIFIIISASVLHGGMGVRGAVPAHLTVTPPIPSGPGHDISSYV